MRTADYRLRSTPVVHIDAAWLEEAYVVKGMSCAEIGRQVGTSPNTIDRRLHALGIPVRTPGKGRTEP